MKKVKKIVSGGLAALFLATSLLVAFFAFLGFGGKSKPTDQVMVSAEETEASEPTVPLADDNFMFRPGAAVRPEGVEYQYNKETEDFDLVLNEYYEDDGLFRLSFSFALLNPAFEKTDHDKDENAFAFTLYRAQTNGAGEPVARYTFKQEGENHIIIRQVLSWYKDIEAIYFDPTQYEDSLVDVLQTETKDEAIVGGYVGDEIFNFRYDDPYIPDVPMLRVCITTSDPCASYFVDFEYHIKDYSHMKRTGFLGLGEKVPVYKDPEPQGKIRSETRSYFQVVSAISAAGKLEKEFVNEAERADVVELIEKTVTKEITIKYLEEVAATPFATMTTKTLTVPVWTTSIPVDTIAAALNVQGFNVHGATVERFVQDPSQGEEVYVAEYLTSCHLIARTADGNVPEDADKYYLNINKSYEDFYYPLYEAGVFSYSAYEFGLNEMRKKYPAIDKIEADELYGHFGYTVLPEMNGINSIFAEPTFNGVTVQLFTKDYLTKDAYDKLLQEFGYTWLARKWNEFLDLFDESGYEAYHYFFYANINGGNVVISDSGTADVMDDDGALKNAADDGIEAVKKTVAELGDKISEKADENDRMLKALLGVGVIGALGCAIVWVIAKIRSGK